jgi:hypothetical protein
MEDKMSGRYGPSGKKGLNISGLSIRAQRGLFVGVILFVALIAFEIFNFDTTQFALRNLLGNVTFLGLQWASILAIAFCAIDFAGLNRLFSPNGSAKEQREVWFLMGAWLLGATMNAVMTWWAVSVTLLNNDFGNEVLNRQQLLRYVPIFVAVLVWLTRILFIGSLTIAGESLFGGTQKRRGASRASQVRSTATRSTSSRSTTPSRIKAAPKQTARPAPRQTASTAPPPVGKNDSGNHNRRPSRVRHRPPMPNGGMRPTNRGIQASGN